ncbi:peptidoglycan-binding protein [Paracoccus sp. p4-l81]|uniref:peptidoglycan-binding domain-containing protein n=1 Tax=Paracoccus sp. p4-l81 TaxID=3342806 RepID=UPI0035B6F79F
MAGTKTRLIPLAVAAMIAVAPVTAQAEVKPIDLIGGILNAQLQAQLKAAQEPQVWEAARQANTAQAYQNYLAAYPHGPNAATAKARLKAMGQAAPGTAPAAGNAAATEADLGLSRADRTRIQSRLTALGYNTRGVDGAFGRGTRNAIATWQRDRGDSVTGYLTAAQVKVLNVGGPATTTTPAPATGTDAAARAEYNLGLSRADRRMVQQQLTGLGYDTRGTDGIFGSGTRRAISNWQNAQGQSVTGYLTADQVRSLRSTAPATPTASSDSDRARIEEGLLGLSRTERAEIQRRLTLMGYDTRGTDGIFGSGTRRAIAAWQGSVGLSATGYLDGDQVSAIRGTDGTASR